MSSALIRIAVFFDGNYLNEVSNYYKFHHPQQSRINLEGLAKFIRLEVSRQEEIDAKRCQIIESHYFRGRFSAETAIDQGRLEGERKFEDVLTRSGIIQHYFPMDESYSQGQEKGIDVALALEAYDLAIHKHLDVLALIACDGDYVPLARKLNSIGTRVLLLAWNFQYEHMGRRKETFTSRALINECSYPIIMNDMIDNGADSEKIQDLFL